jgi:arsenite methyltransferase
VAARGSTHAGVTPWLFEVLADPADGSELNADGDSLVGRSGVQYPVVDGIPRFVAADEDQTADSFGFKWSQQGSYGSDEGQRENARWIAEKYGFETPERMREYFGSRRLILDVGCGAGYTTSHWMAPGWSRSARWVGLELSRGIDLARRRLEHCGDVAFVQADLLAMPFRPGTFDTAFAEGVLHHTPSTRSALESTARVVASGGELLFYVYRRKAPLREFADDYVRALVTDLPPEQAWEELRPLTRLGEALAKLDVEVDVPEDVPQLGIPAGRHDVQRLTYWHFAKLFWNDAYSFEENHHVNFDWYHPRYAHRQTEDQLRAWCDELSLTVHHLHEQESGFTVRALKR